MASKFQDFGGNELGARLGGGSIRGRVIQQMARREGRKAVLVNPHQHGIVAILNRKRRGSLEQPALRSL